MPLQANYNTGAGPYDRTLFNLNVQPVVPFPGEKWNVIARTMVLVEGDTIYLSDLPPQVLQTPQSKDRPAVAANGALSGTLRERVRQFEISLINEAIDAAGGDRQTAARIAGRQCAQRGPAGVAGGVGAAGGGRRMKDDRRWTPAQNVAYKRCGPQKTWDDG